MKDNDDRSVVSRDSLEDGVNLTTLLCRQSCPVPGEGEGEKEREVDREREMEEVCD